MAPANSYDFFFSNLVQLMAAPTSSLLLLLSFIAAAYSLLRRSRGHLRLPPGPWGLPIVGYVPFLRRDLHQQLAELAKTHGPIMRLRLGAKTCVVITSPDIAGEIFRGQDAIFANRDPPASAVALTYGGQDLVWSPNGPLWRLLRKLTVREVMSPAHLDAFASLRRLEVSQMLHHIVERAEGVHHGVEFHHGNALGWDAGRGGEGEHRIGVPASGGRGNGAFRGGERLRLLPLVGKVRPTRSCEGVGEEKGVVGSDSR